MSTKNELQLILKTFGYDLNPNTSKNTLVNLLHLHTKALEYGIDLPKIDDHELHCYLNKYDIITGPVISHTRIIYQLQLLEAINNEKIDENNKNLQPFTIDIEDGMITRSGRIILKRT